MTCKDNISGYIDLAKGYILLRELGILTKSNEEESTNKTETLLLGGIR